MCRTVIITKIGLYYFLDSCRWGSLKHDAPIYQAANWDCSDLLLAEKGGEGGKYMTSYETGPDI